MIAILDFKLYYRVTGTKRWRHKIGYKDQWSRIEDQEITLHSPAIFEKDTKTYTGEKTVSLKNDREKTVYLHVKDRTMTYISLSVKKSTPNRSKALMKL
jgi:hypothetical protein